MHVLLDGSTATGEGYGFTVVSEDSERGIGRLFCQVTPSAKNGAKLESNDKEYCKFYRQASNVVIDSRLVSDHCLGARLVFIVIGTLVRIKGKEFVLNHRPGWFAAALLQSCSSAIGDVGSVDAATTPVRRKETANSEQLYRLTINRL